MPKPDRVSWKHLKTVINNNKCLNNIVQIVNTCINLGYWPLYFKMSLLVIIPKPNKASYNKNFLPHCPAKYFGKINQKSHWRRTSISSNFKKHPS